MKNKNMIERLGICLVIAGIFSVSMAQAEEWIELLKSEPIESFRKPTAKWAEFGNAFLNAQRPKELSTEPGTGVIYNGGKTNNILTKMEHGDAEIHIEFMVPEGSNSGVYFQGRYEIQVLDSWGKEKVEHSDCGGIYQRWVDQKGFDGHPPRVNASKKPGEWQTFNVIFKAPRFDPDGNKTSNAMFVKVVHNGVTVHENVELTGSTRSAAFSDENARGPIMLQGNHGPVAYRNFKIQHLDLSGK